MWILPLAQADAAATQHDVIKKIDVAARLDPARAPAATLPETRELVLVACQQAFLILDAVAQRLELLCDLAVIARLHLLRGALDALHGALHLLEQLLRFGQRGLPAFGSSGRLHDT